VQALSIHASLYKIKNKAHSLTLAQARKSQSILRLSCAKAQTAQTEQQISQTAKRAKNANNATQQLMQA
jgi:hypothetical protein